MCCRDSLEQEEDALETVRLEASADVEKGQHTIVQLGLVDSFLETRIRLQV